MDEEVLLLHGYGTEVGGGGGKEERGERVKNKKRKYRGVPLRR